MFKATITGLAGVQKQFASAAADAKDIVEQELAGMAKNWVDGAVRDAPVDEGTLKGSISYFEASSPTGKSFNIVAQAFYAAFMEFGTKGKYVPIPGTEKIAAQFKGMKGGDFMTLLRMIVRWVRRKGISGVYSVKTRKRTGNKINQFAEDYKVAWPIALSILKNGISPHPFFFKQQETVWPQMVSNIQKRLEKRTKVSVILPADIKKPRIITI